MGTIREDIDMPYILNFMHIYSQEWNDTTTDYNVDIVPD